MGSLIVNETIKLFKKKSGWVMPIMVVLSMLGMVLIQLKSNQVMKDSMPPEMDGYVYKGGIDAYEMPDGQILSENEFWEQEEPDYENTKMVSVDLPTSIEMLKKDEQKYARIPKPDEYERSERKRIKKKIEYYQAYDKAGDLPPNGREGTTSAQFFSSFGSIYGLTTLIAVIIASMMLAAEFTGGTIKLLLTRPFSRTQILLSKYIVTLLYSFGISLLMGLSAFVFSFLLPRQSLLVPLAEDTGSRGAIDIALSLFASNFLLLIFYVTVAFFFSGVVRSQALAVGIGMGILFSGSVLGQILPTLIERYDFLKWLIFNMLNLNQRVVDSGYIVGGNLSIGAMVVGIIIYTLLVLSATIILFNKRDVALS